MTETDLANMLAANDDLGRRNPSLRLSPESRLDSPSTVHQPRSGTIEPSEPVSLAEPPRGLNGAGQKRRKYRNVPTVIEGERFDSKKEGARWLELRLLEKAGEIKDLTRQVAYSVDIHGEHICTYKADFQYYEKMRNVKSGWKLIAEDCKGFKTPVYKLKKKLVHAIFGVTIRET